MNNKMVLYTIFRNDELIYARNFSFDNLEQAKQGLADTYTDIKNDKNVTDINFSEDKLEFISKDEKHIMFIK